MNSNKTSGSQLKKGMNANKTSVSELKKDMNNLYQGAKTKRNDIVKEGIKEMKGSNEELLNSIKGSRYKNMIARDHNLINVENVSKFESLIKYELSILTSLTEKDSEELIDIYYKEFKLPYDRNLHNDVNKCGAIFDEGYTDSAKREYDHCVKGLYIKKLNEYETINHSFLRAVTKWAAKHNEYNEKYSKLLEKNKKIYDSKRKKLYSVIKSYDEDTKEYTTLMTYYNELEVL